MSRPRRSAADAKKASDSIVARSKRRPAPPTESAELRIVGGRFRGRKLRYEPFLAGADAITRPMKHRVRESIFNLVSTEPEGRHAIDLFAGTGALGLEALSRGAVHATFIERHVPTARIIEENIKSLGVERETTLLTTSAFLWGKRQAGARAQEPRNGVQAEPGERAGSSGGLAPEVRVAALPWLVFCSPPYAFYLDRQGEMLELVCSVMDGAPAGSILVVESDERFDFGLLPEAPAWDVRTYAPAVVGVWRKAAE
jgi:16S rRNA (guanine966-N2)-methyltransferase